MYAFCHIPKTAGTTLNYLLQKNFGSDLNNIIPRNGTNYLYGDLKKDQFLYKNAKCISGHGLKPFIDYKEFNKQLKWFTFLRDPIQRFVSQYIHQQTSSLTQYHMPIEKWAKKYARSNWQVKWIAGEEDFDAAKQILEEKFVFIGLTEKFNESLIGLKGVIQNNFDITYGKPKMQVRDDSLKNELLVEKYESLYPFYKEQNDLDIKLYDFVKDKLYPIQVKNSVQKLVLKKEDKSNNLGVWQFKLKQNLLYKPYVYITKK